MNHCHLGYKTNLKKNEKKNKTNTEEATKICNLHKK